MDNNCTAKVHHSISLQNVGHFCSIKSCPNISITKLSWLHLVGSTLASYTIQIIFLYIYYIIYYIYVYIYNIFNCQQVYTWEFPVFFCPLLSWCTGGLNCPFTWSQLLLWPALHQHSQTIWCLCQNVAKANNVTDTFNINRWENIC